MIIFRLPFSNQCYTVEEKNNGDYPIEFQGFTEKYLLRFQGEIKEISEDEITLTSNHLTSNHQLIEELTKKEYLNKIESIISFIIENQLQKLVFSRKKIIADYKEIDLVKSFSKLCNSYPNAFVYLFHHGNNCWIGAFSELLGKFNFENNEFSTMSLAGTLPVEEEWTLKEIEEQKPVTDYINAILASYDRVDKSATYDHISGKIKHLRTDFKLKISPDKIDEIIKQLHPTPAVCGIPKDFCKKAITNFENEDRKFYSGYSKIKIKNEVYYFVNLRCAEIYQNNAYLYVGGGITKDSNPIKEWHETELKSHAILDNLVIN